MSLLRFFARCGRMMTSPAATAEEIVANRIHLGGWLLNGCAGVPPLLWVGEALWPEASTATALALASVAAVVSAVVSSGLTHALARALGGRGRFRTLVALGGYAAVPFLAFGLAGLCALAAYTRLLGAVPLGPAGVLGFLLLLLVVLVAALILARHGVAANYGLSGRRAWTVVLVGTALLALLSNGLASPFVSRQAVTFANLRAVAVSLPPFTTATAAEAQRLSLDLAVNLRFYRQRAIARGDVVVVRDADGTGWLVRVLGLPGEEAGLSAGRLVVHGQAWPETWPARGDLTLAPRRLAMDEYLVGTDDRLSGLKLRQHEDVPTVVRRDQILGPPLRIHGVLSRWLFGR